MKQPDFKDLEALSRTIWGEARGEPRLGKTAVAHVILNRWRAQRPRYGLTIWEVCRKPYQFSCWNEADPNLAVMESCALNDGPLRECVVVALETIAGTTSDPTKGAKHYHSTGIIPPPWAAQGQVSAEIANHIFYQGVP